LPAARAVSSGWVRGPSSITEAAVRIGVHKAKTSPSRLLGLVDTGQEIDVMRNGAPVARLVPAGSKRKRRFGADRAVKKVTPVA
jgi:antitoxin (DNA-binding transcriptional repressor) of toxin-antitoxin stability system